MSTQVHISYSLSPPVDLPTVRCATRTMLLLRNLQLVFNITQRLSHMTEPIGAI